MFSFIVRHLGFLKHIPLFAWLLDAFMMIWNSLMNRDIPASIGQIEKEVTTWDDIHLTLHKFGGLQFNCRDKEIGHIHSNGILDILFNTAIKRDLVLRGLAREHHVFTRSGWISFYIHTEADVDTAIRLLRLSYMIAAGKRNYG